MDMTLAEMAAEYRNTINTLVKRIDELQERADAEPNNEMRRRLHKQIQCLKWQVSDLRYWSREMEHYYDA